VILGSPAPRAPLLRFAARGRARGLDGHAVTRGGGGNKPSALHIIEPSSNLLLKIYINVDSNLGSDRADRLMHCSTALRRGGRDWNRSKGRGAKGQIAFRVAWCFSASPSSPCAPGRPASSRQARPRTTSPLRPVGRRTTSSSRRSSTRSVDGPRRPGTSSSTGAARSRLRPAGGLWRLRAGGGPSDCPLFSGAATRRQCKAALRETSTATRPTKVTVDRQSFRTRASLPSPFGLCTAPRASYQNFPRKPQFVSPSPSPSAAAAGAGRCTAPFRRPSREVPSLHSGRPHSTRDSCRRRRPPSNRRPPRPAGCKAL
jgi:hypothetical protein